MENERFIYNGVEYSTIAEAQRVLLGHRSGRYLTIARKNNLSVHNAARLEIETKLTFRHLEKKYINAREIWREYYKSKGLINEFKTIVADLVVETYNGRLYIEPSDADLLRARIERFKNERTTAKPEYTQINYCQWCGAVMPLSRNKLCSTQCQTEAAKEAARRHRKAYRYKQHAIKHNQPLDVDITARSVAERFDYRCQICGNTVTPSASGGVNDDWQPKAWTVGHINPPSLGGSHTWANVQCECMECNTLKGQRHVSNAEALRIVRKAQSKNQLQLFTASGNPTKQARLGSKH